MTLYNLHIIRSPLQLLNILEAIESMELKNNVLLIIDRQSESNTAQIQEVLKAVDYKWTKQFHIKKTSKSNLLAYVKLLKELKTLNIDHMFMGDIDSISNAIIANVSPQKVFLVDDGTSTLKRHEALLIEKKLRFKDKLKLFRFNLFGLKGYKPYKINFFSFFDLVQKRDEIIVKNEFKSLKSKFKLSQNYSNKVYILGQPIYKKEISEEDFLIHLTKILESYSDKEMIYLKHRYETPTEEIKNLLALKNVTIEQNEYPIELEFLIRREYPMHITGFFSTAIYTLSRMFGEADAKAFYLEKELFFNKERSEVVDNYYDFFIQSGIKVIGKENI